MVRVRTLEELERALNEQRLALESSSTAYDNGSLWEATRVATAVSVLVHDGGKHYKSILSCLCIRGSLRFVSSAFQYSPRNVLRETHLVRTHIYGDGRAEYRPILGNFSHPIRLLQFRKWWEDELIFRDRSFRLTRKKLAFALRNQEGGAHFEPIIQDPNYLRFSQEQLTTPFVAFGDAPPKPMLGAELASMRQIAWELLETLKRKNVV